MSLAFDAGWSSPVARQAHNLKVVSSNLAPATIMAKRPTALLAGRFSFSHTSQLALAVLAWIPERSDNPGRSGSLPVIKTKPGHKTKSGGYP